MLVCVVIIGMVFKRGEEPFFNQVAASRAIRTVKRTHVLDRACQAWCRFDACGIDRQLDGKQLVGPSAALEDFFSTDKRALFQSEGNARAVSACQIQLFPKL